MTGLNRHRPLAIAGAGIAGLGLALALLRQGRAVQVFEQASQLGEVGAGVQLSPNGTRVLLHWGLEPALAPRVCEAAGKEIRIGHSGQRWKLFDLGADCRARFGAPYWMVHRGELHQALLQAVLALDPHCLQTGTAVRGVQDLGDAVQLRLDDGRSVWADALVAADGVHSGLRQQLLGEDHPHFTGLLAWRGLVPWGQVPEALREPVGSNWVGPGAHVISYPVSAGRLMNVVGIVERSDWLSESWTEAGAVDEMLADFAGWHPEVRALMAAIGQPFRWALLGRAPRRGWAQGRICLIGDAAHPTLPFLAQGANMAIEDAAVLARCLEAATAPQHAFARFEAARWQRTADIVNRSRDNAQRFHHPELADPLAAVAYVEREWQPEAVRRRYDWLFEYDPLTVALP